jgi:hypothetical protein
MQSAADIGLRAAYHAHSEKPSPIFSTAAAAFCYRLTSGVASNMRMPQFQSGFNSPVHDNMDKNLHARTAKD